MGVLTSSLACREPPPHEKHPDAVVDECRELAGSADSHIEWWKIDMADFSSVDSFAQKWLDTGRPLDVLCNNAGIAWGPSRETTLTKDGFRFRPSGNFSQPPEWKYQNKTDQRARVNFLSQVLLTLRLLPSLSLSPGARIVCTTSCHHFLSMFDLDHFHGEPGMGRERLRKQ